MFTCRSVSFHEENLSWWKTLSSLSLATSVSAITLPETLEKMTHKNIQTIGNFLSTYATDLNYIKNFQDFKFGRISAENYAKKTQGSFYSFLIEFRIIRNIEQDKSYDLLLETLKWIEGENPNDVDAFAVKLSKTNLTRNSIPKSLASKVLFLNNPWEIFPMDKLARNALNVKNNDYKKYLNELKIFAELKKVEIEKCFEQTSHLGSVINSKFDNIKKIELIQKNRFLDKYLWTEERKGFW